jgi:TonB family protein
MLLPLKLAMRARMSSNSLRSATLIVLAIIAASTVFAQAQNMAAKVDTSKPTPVIYPVAAQRAGEEGTVVVDVFVPQSGKPQRFHVAKSSGYPDLDDAAVATALNWKYVPAFRDGDSVSEWAAVQVVYKLPTMASYQSR